MRASMGPIFLLPVGILVALTTLWSVSAAPLTYDQRQEGKYNVQAKFDNLLFVVAFPSKPDLFGILADQALELSDLALRSKQKTEVQAEPGKEQAPEVVVYETEESHVGREPYHVEIVHIDKEGEFSAEKKSLELASQPSEAKEPVNSGEKSLAALEEHLEVEKDAQSDAPLDEVKPGKKSRSLWSSVGRELDGTLEKQSDLVDTVNAAASGYQTETLAESKDELSKSGKPGLSMKKQLSKKDQESMYLSLREKNDVPSHQGKPEELKLLGDAIENCGPERYRDSSGICQAEKNVSAK